VDGANTWVLEVSPRTDSRFTYKGKVWVSMADFAVVRILGAPAKNPTWLMGNAHFDYRYGRSEPAQAGPRENAGAAFWLPRQSVTVSHLRVGGEITLTVDYGTYQLAARPGGAATEAVNAGLRRQPADGQP